MILVDDLPVPIPTDASSPLSHQEENLNLLLSLLQHPSLVSASSLLKSTPERSAQQLIGQHKHVYVFQREYATVDPQLVQFIGTDEATTCVGIVIRNRESGITSVAHLDSPSCVDYGLIQMLSLVVDHETSTPLDVHLIGGFKDADDKELDSNTGHSFPICSKVIEALQSSREKFHLQTLYVLGHNTRKNSSGYCCPVICGFLVETSTGSVIPAKFDINSRCPDELVRRLRVTVSSGDPSWQGKLLETYDSRLDRFNIAPCLWSPDWAYYAVQMLQLSNSDFLLQGSTSPFAEGPDFVETQRRVFSYLIKYPSWKQAFPKKRHRIFKRTIAGWSRCND